MTNREDWNGHIYIVDAETNEPMDLTDCRIDLVIRSERFHNKELHLYYIPDAEPNGITVRSDGHIWWTVREKQMRKLREDFYEVGMNYRDPNNNITQLFVGELEIVKGVVE